MKYIQDSVYLTMVSLSKYYIITVICNISYINGINKSEKNQMSDSFNCNNVWIEHVGKLHSYYLEGGGR